MKGKEIIKKLVGYFLQGLLYIVPVVVTLYVTITAVKYIDELISSIPYISEHLEARGIPGLGLLTIVVLICIAGWIMPILLSTPIAGLMHRVLNTTPLVGIVYSSVKDLMSAFVGKKKKFGQPVLVNMDDSGILHRMGFVMQEEMAKMGAEGMVAVYLPSSYGLLGDLIVVPRSKVKKLDDSSADVMKFIVSGGVTNMDTDEK